MWRNALTPLSEAPCQAPPLVSSAPAFLPQLFHEAAYQADDRQDLLSAISEFLDGSIVIPPSEVEGRDLLRSVAAFQRELLRKRREREQNKVEMTTRGGYVAPGKGQTLGDPEPPMLPHTAKSMTSAPSCLPESGCSFQPLTQASAHGRGREGWRSGLCSSSPLFPRTVAGNGELRGDP